MRQSEQNKTTDCKVREDILDSNAMNNTEDEEAEGDSQHCMADVPFSWKETTFLAPQRKDILHLPFDQFMLFMIKHVYGTLLHWMLLDQESRVGIS